VSYKWCKYDIFLNSNEFQKLKYAAHFVLKIVNLVISRALVSLNFKIVTQAKKIRLNSS
jgi:hypothetical protein